MVLHCLKDNLAEGPITGGGRLLQQDAWARQQCAANGSDLWAGVAHLLAQQDGMAEGYNARVASLPANGGAGPQLPSLSKADFLLLSAVGGPKQLFSLHRDALQQLPATFGRARGPHCPASLSHGPSQHLHMPSSQ